MVDPIPDGDLYERIAAPNSKFRWCWKTRKLFQVANPDSYRSRFDHFATFYRGFYAGAKLDYSLDPYRGHNWYQVNGGEMLIAAFNSCDQNDCYNFCGSIADGEISRSQLNRPKSRVPCRLLMAVWHHDVEGPPLRTDYMNAEVIPLMIDKGFQVGLHGHHHRSEFRPVTIRFSGAQSMAVISSGSLAAGDRDLPPGVNRQYNILRINDDFSSGELFVREMTVPGIFSDGRLPTLGGRSSCKLDWTPRTIPAMPATATAADVEAVERMLHDRKFAEALAALQNVSMPAHYKHQLLTQALRGAEMWPELVQHLANSHAADDLTGAVEAAIKMKGWGTAVGILDAADAAGIFPSLTAESKSAFALSN